MVLDIALLHHFLDFLRLNPTDNLFSIIVLSFKLLLNFSRCHLLVRLLEHARQDLGSTIHHFFVAYPYYVVERLLSLHRVELGRPDLVKCELVKSLLELLRKNLLDGINFLVVLFLEHNQNVFEMSDDAIDILDQNVITSDHHLFTFLFRLLLSILFLLRSVFSLWLLLRLDLVFFGFDVQLVLLECDEAFSRLLGTLISSSRHLRRWTHRQFYHIICGIFALLLGFGQLDGGLFLPLWNAATYCFLFILVLQSC